MLTAPVSLTGIVFGKFLSAVVVYLIALSVYVPYTLILYSFAGTVDIISILGNFVALLLLGSAFIAIGVFVSSLTESQVVAAIVSFVIILVFFMIDMLAANVPNEFVSEIMTSLGFFTKYVEFSTGVFDISSIVYFISTIFVFNFLTVRVLEKRRWAN